MRRPTLVSLTGILTLVLVCLTVPAQQPTGKQGKGAAKERIDFNDKWEELHRESMLHELQQRIRDVRQSPDGFLYVLTAENDELMKIEPATSAAAGP